MGSPRVVVVQHVIEEGLGHLGEVLAERGATVAWVRPGEELSRSALDGAAGLVVLGGPMGVYEVERHPRLAVEMQTIEAALATRIPVIGICLGSQLLASVLGARVYASGRQEVGWHEVTLESAASADALFGAAPPRFDAFHWHGDVFDLPKGTTHLARTGLTEHQAYAYEGRAWGVLFHLEVDADQIARMVSGFPEDVSAAGLAPDALVADSSARVSQMRDLARAVFGRWADLLPPT